MSLPDLKKKPPEQRYKLLPVMPVMARGSVLRTKQHVSARVAYAIEEEEQQSGGFMTALPGWNANNMQEESDIPVNTMGVYVKTDQYSTRSKTKIDLYFLHAEQLKIVSLIDCAAGEWKYLTLPQKRTMIKEALENSFEMISEGDKHDCQ